MGIINVLMVLHSFNIVFSHTEVSNSNHDETCDFIMQALLYHHCAATLLTSMETILFASQFEDKFLGDSFDPILPLSIPVRPRMEMGRPKSMSSFQS